MPPPIDISVPLGPGIATWPNSVGVESVLTLSFAAGDGVNVTRLQMDVHCGTHVEAPLHYIEDGAPVGSIPLEALIGPAYVATVAVTDQIDGEALESSDVPQECTRLLLRTSNSNRGLLKSNDFTRDFAGLTQDGARWIADRGISLVGADYLSIQHFDADPEVHRILMRAGVAILEGVDLSDVRPGTYRLTCLPLRLPAAEAAPARAILEPMA